MLRTRVRVGQAGSLVLAVVMAAILTAVSSAELFLGALTPHFGLPSPVVLRVPYHARVVRQGPKAAWTVQLERSRIVVPRGTVLQPESEEHRAAVLLDQSNRPPRVARLGSLFLLYLFGVLVPLSYFRNFGNSRLRLLRSQVGVLALLTVVVIGAKAALLFTPWSDFWLPVGALALWIAVGFDRRTAIVVDLTAALIVASFLGFDLLLLGVLVTRGTTASLLFLNHKRPRQMLIAGALSGVAGALAYVAMRVMLEGHVGLLSDLSRGLGSNVLACVGGGLLSGLLGLLLRDVGAAAVGRVSRDKLLDLTDIESPLLQKMAVDAPGSWEHSRAMANLAEAAAAAVGADALLTRVGAYYHDVGKSAQPRYFVENLAPGEPSPHDELAPEVSADAIMAHVVIGTSLLRETGLPESVVEFVYTHHGTQRVEYFWRKHLQQCERDGTNPLPEDNFRYPGTAPMTKENAILMLVDAIEAASRTVQPPDRERFRGMIRQVMFDKLADGQLDDSGLTIHDMRLMVDRMTNTLVNMYHGRIKYPWQVTQEKQEAQNAAVSANASPNGAETHSGVTAAAHPQADTGNAGSTHQDAPSGNAPGSQNSEPSEAAPPSGPAEAGVGNG